MRKVLIVDDEPMVQEGLKKVIPWSEHGYEVCGVGVDGRDGLNKIRSHVPDLVLIDIRMPGFSGIDVIKQAKEEGYSCKFVILSGYSSFSYAKESLKLGIVAYLLKPVDEEELIQIVEEVSTELDKEEKISTQLSHYKEMTEEQTLINLLDGKWDLINPVVLSNFEGVSLQVARFLTDINRTGISHLRKLLIKYSNTIRLIHKNNKVCLLFIDMKEKEVITTLKELIGELVLYGNTKSAVTLGKPVTEYKEVKESFRQTVLLKDMYYSHRTKELFTYRMLEGEGKPFDFEESKNAVIRYVEFKDLTKIKSELNKMERYYQGIYVPQERINTELIDYMISVFRALHAIHPSIEFKRKEKIVDEILKKESLKDALAFIFSEFKHISEDISGMVSMRDPVERIKDYVDHYYFDDLNLKQLAALFNYNSSYLGKKFKKQTGKSFHTYLDIVRINNAKVMLEKRKKKVYEISKKVGYCNIDYFYKKFKKYEGVSPKEYQKMSHDSKLTN